MKKVADKLASFVAKNGRQFENITRQKNPGDTPFKYVHFRIIFGSVCSVFIYMTAFFLFCFFSPFLLFSMFCVFDVLLCPDSFLMRAVLITNTMNTGLLKRKKLFYIIRNHKLLKVVSIVFFPLTT